MVKELRGGEKKNKLSLKEAAMVIGVSEKTLIGYENGVKWPDRVKYYKLMKVINKTDLL